MTMTRWIPFILFGTGCVNEFQMNHLDSEIAHLAEDTSNNSLHHHVLVEQNHEMCESSITVLSPMEKNFATADSHLDLSVQVHNPQDNQWVQWTDESGTILAETPLTKDGSAHLRLNPDQVYPNVVLATLQDSNDVCTKTVKHRVIVCEEVIDNLNRSDDWVYLGDAYWSDLGWAELTHNTQASQGAVFNPNVRIPSGTASIRFTVQTGNGIHNGADGLALTIIDVENPSSLEELILSAPPGGGLGYGVGGDEGFWTGDALTIEIDTWPNVEAHENYDPTEENHIAITRNADPSQHVIWSAVPDIEDFQPHDIQVDITPEDMRIYYDGQEIAHQRKPDFFNGGYLFLSGSTGWATNRHRVSDLEILHTCQ